MTEKDILVEVLTKTQNMTENEVTDFLYKKAEDSDELILNEDAPTLILDKDVQRISKIKSAAPTDNEITKSYEKGWAAGKSESMEKFEKQLKTKFGVESTVQGLDLVQEVVDTVSECNTEITDDKIKASALYRALEENSVPKEDYEKSVSDLEDYRSKQDRLSRFGKVKTDALSQTAELKPIVSENVNVAKTRQDLYLKEFESYDYELKDDGNHFVIKDGKRIEDSHGHPIPFSEHVSMIASKHYEFKVSDDKGQSGNRDTGNNGQSNVKVPKDKEEYLRQYADLRGKGLIPEATALAMAWEASQQN